MSSLTMSNSSFQLTSNSYSKKTIISTILLIVSGAVMTILFKM